MPYDLHLYPAHWIRFSYWVRYRRAGERCECTGECYPGPKCPHQGRCPHQHRKSGIFQQGHVVLTTAHLCSCHPLCAIPSHVKAMCQSCHLRFDRYQHTKRNGQYPH